MNSVDCSELPIFERAPSRLPTLNSKSFKIVAAEQPSWSFTAAPAATMSLEASAAVAQGSSGGGGEGSGGGDVDKWIAIAKECKYLPENDLKVTLQLREG